MRGTIVGIGGGLLRLGETEQIDRKILSLTGKERPRVLFIPAASGDFPLYCSAFKREYGKIGARVDILRLVRRGGIKSIRKKIMDSDAIYVGGGEMAKLLEVWNEYGLTKLMTEAMGKGVVLSGLSAGCGIYFSKVVEQSKEGEFIVTNGSGMIRKTVFPHFVGVRVPGNIRGSGVVCVPNNSAVVYRNGDLQGAININEASAIYIGVDGKKTKIKSFDD